MNKLIIKEKLNSVNIKQELKRIDITQIGKRGQKGEIGDTGLSAYQIWINQGNIGDEEDFIASLEGAKGDKGDAGIGIASGGLEGQILSKNSNADYDTKWINFIESKSILNRQSVVAMPYSFGETTANAQIVGFGLSTTYLEGIQATNKIFNTNELYFARSRALFKHSNSPASQGLQSYIALNNDFYIGKTGGVVGGFNNLYDFAIEDNLDNKAQVFVGLCSEFIRVPSFALGLETVRNLLGIGYNMTDSIFHIYTNDNNNLGANKIPLTSFIGNLTLSDIQARVKENPYTLEINVDSPGGNIKFTFTNLVTKNSGYYILPVGTRIPTFSRYLKPCFITATGQTMPRADGIVFYKFIGYSNYYA